MSAPTVATATPFKRQRRVQAGADPERGPDGKDLKHRHRGLPLPAQHHRHNFRGAHRQQQPRGDRQPREDLHPVQVRRSEPLSVALTLRHGREEHLAQHPPEMARQRGQRRRSGVVAERRGAEQLPRLAPRQRRPRQARAGG